MAENDQTDGTENTSGDGTQDEDQKPDTKPTEGGSGDGSEGGDEGDKWTPPTKDEHDRMKSALAARKADVNRLKAELKAKETESDKADPAAEADLRLKRSATRSALEAAGLSKEGAKSALKIVNLDALELDEDGDVDAADLLELIRTAFAPLFKTTGKPTPGKPISSKKPGSGDDGKKTSARRLLESAGFLSHDR